MSKQLYKVTGCIELNWANYVEAETEEEAIRLACGYAEDGHGHDEPVGSPDPDDCYIELANADDVVNEIEQL